MTGGVTGGVPGPIIPGGRPPGPVGGVTGGVTGGTTGGVAAPGAPVLSIAVDTAPTFTSTTCAADFPPGAAANTVCLPGLTKTGSGIGLLPTVVPSMLTSA